MAENTEKNTTTLGIVHLPSPSTEEASLHRGWICQGLAVRAQKGRRMNTSHLPPVGSNRTATAFLRAGAPCSRSHGSVRKLPMAALLARDGTDMRQIRRSTRNLPMAAPPTQEGTDLCQMHQSAQIWPGTPVFL